MAIKQQIIRAGLFAGMAAVGSTVVPKMTKKQTQKSARKKLTAQTSKIDFDNMGPEIVRKDKSKGDDQ